MQLASVRGMVKERNARTKLRVARKEKRSHQGKGALEKEGGGSVLPINLFLGGGGISPSDLKGRRPNVSKRAEGRQELMVSRRGKSLEEKGKEA